MTDPGPQLTQLASRDRNLPARGHHILDDQDLAVHGAQGGLGARIAERATGRHFLFVSRCTCSGRRGETMTCGTNEALRHFKNGVLKCAPAVKVVDCTERTNLRKWGTGDMFFSYIAQVCLETGQEMVGGQSHEYDSASAGRPGSAY